MFTRLREAGVLWATLCSIPALLLLVGLGTWQLQRKAWKDDLQATIDRRATARPVDISEALSGAKERGAAGYTRVKAKGRFKHESELYYYAPEPKTPGWHVYTPMQLEDGRWLLVNRGFVPDGLRDRGKRSGGLLPGVVAVTGLLREPGQKGTFTPENDVQNNAWYWRDLDGMARVVFANEPRAVIPYSLDVEREVGRPGAALGETWPRGGATITKLANRHLEYSLTWFGLALTLIGVYGAFVYGRIRSRPLTL